VPLNGRILVVSRLTQVCGGLDLEAGRSRGARDASVGPEHRDHQPLLQLRRSDGEGKIQPGRNQVGKNACPLPECVCLFVFVLVFVCLFVCVFVCVCVCACVRLNCRAL